MDFKYYITYAKMVQHDDLPKRFDKLSKVLKKYKLELVFWGHPFGTTENLILVMKGTVGDYQNSMMQSDLSEAMNFFTDNKTHFVMAP
jgi:hypothetical protein